MSPEDKLLLSHIDDMLYRCEKNYAVSYSSFLDERECALSEEYLKRSHTECKYLFYGGYEGAGRKILCVLSQYEEAELSDFPIRAVRFSYRAADRLTHRDFLGSLMSMQIKRNLIGDIVCGEGETYAFLSPVAADMAISCITKVGRVGVKCSAADGSSVVRHDSFTEISGTAASLRLDCVLGIALRQSREKCAALIKGGSVTVNCFPQESVSAAVKDGDTLSVRGFGRYIVCTDGQLTAKGRIHVTVKKFK